IFCFFLLKKYSFLHRTHVKIDHSFLTSSPVLFDAFFIPDGDQSINELKETTDFMEFINLAYKHLKPILISKNAEHLLEKATFYKTVKKESADKTGVIISSANLKEDINSFIEMIKEHKVW